MSGKVYYPKKANRKLLLPRDSETDVVVRITRAIVQIQCQDTSIAAIVPIATADEAVQTRLIII